MALRGKADTCAPNPSVSFEREETTFHAKWWSQGKAPFSPPSTYKFLDILGTSFSIGKMLFCSLAHPVSEIGCRLSAVAEARR